MIRLQDATRNVGQNYCITDVIDKNNTYTVTRGQITYWWLHITSEFSLCNHLPDSCDKV